MFRAIALATFALAALPPGAPAADTSPPAWMTIAAAQKTVTFEIQMAKNGNNGTLNFNGYGHGDMTLVVPAGWRVMMHVLNKGAGGIPHSLEVLPITEAIPQQGSEPPAFSGAETVSLVDGMKTGQSDDVDFVADTPGKYWIFCGVPNHGVGGMWDYLVVSATASAPSVQLAVPKA